MVESLKGGALTLESVDVPESVPPGRAVTATATVANDAGFIDPLDPDQCQGSGSWLANYGFTTTVEFTDPNGETQQVSACVPYDDGGTHRETFEFTFTAPESEGTASVDARMVLEGSGAQTGLVSDTMVVGSRPPAEGDGDTHDSSGDGSDNGFNLPGSDPGGSGSPLGIDTGDWKILIGLIALAIIVSSGAGAVESAT